MSSGGFRGFMERMRRLSSPRRQRPPEEIPLPQPPSEPVLDRNDPKRVDPRIESIFDAEDQIKLKRILISGSENPLTKLYYKIGNIVKNNERDKLEFVVQTIQSITDTTRFVRSNVSNIFKIVYCTVMGLKQALEGQKLDMFTELYLVCMQLLHRNGLSRKDMNNYNLDFTVPVVNAIVLCFTDDLDTNTGKLIINEGANKTSNENNYDILVSIIRFSIDDEMDENDSLVNLFQYLQRNGNLSYGQMKKAMLISIEEGRLHFFKYISQALTNLNENIGIEALVYALGEVIISYKDKLASWMRLRFVRLISDRIKQKIYHEKTIQLFEIINDIQYRAYLHYISLWHLINYRVSEPDESELEELEQRQTITNYIYDNVTLRLKNIVDSNHWLFMETRTSKPVRMPIVSVSADDEEPDIDQITKDQIQENDIYVKCKNDKTPHRFLYTSYEEWCGINPSTCHKCPICTLEMEAIKYINT